MAKKTNGTASASTITETKKYNSSAKRRTSGDLMNSEKGKIIKVISGSASLANLNERKGLELGSKSNSKNLAGRLNSIRKVGGKLDMMDVNSDTYTKLLSLAKSAKNSLVKGNYDNSVIAFMNYVLSLQGSGGGKRGFNATSFDFDF